MASDDSLIAEAPIFQRLSDGERNRLGACMTHANFTAGETIFRAGDPGDTLYLVRSGKVALTMRDHMGQAIELEHCARGNIFGELSLLDGGTRTATATASDDTECLVLEREQLLQFLRESPDAALGLLATVSERVRKADELARGLAARNANEVVANKLSLVDRIADAIAAFSGSVSFLVIHVVLFAVWIGLNLGAIPGVDKFDPYPFGLLTMAVSLEAIFLSVFVLLSQNLQAAKDRVRADIEYEVNLKAEMEVAHLHEKMDRLHEEAIGRLHRLERRLKGAVIAQPKP